MFEIRFNPQLKVLEWTMSGFWSEADVQRFDRALQAEMARIRAEHPRFYCLSDTRGFPVQSDAVMRMFAGLTQRAEGARRFAILVSSALNQLQASRSFHDDRVAVFRDRDDALKWLLAAPVKDAKAA